MRRKQPTGVGAAMADDRDKLISLERRGAEHKGKQTSVSSTEQTMTSVGNAQPKDAQIKA